MKMKTIIKYIILIVLTTAAVSCTKSKLETTYNKQESQIDSYISGKTDCRVVRNGGANRVILTEGEGEELSPDGFISFYYAGYTFNGSFNAGNLFTTNHRQTAEQSKWELTDPDYEIFETNLSDAKLLQGLKDGLVGVRAGEECEILFTGKFGFGNENFGIIPAKSALLYKIWVVGVTND